LLDGRTRADFRALRETVGMSQTAMSDRLGVAVRSVRRWEELDTDGWQEPPQDAWDVLDEARALQRHVVAYAVRRVLSAREEMGAAPERVELAYWPDALTYDERHDADGIDDWRMANANARLVGVELARRGFQVTYRFPGEGEASDAAIDASEE